MDDDTRIQVGATVTGKQGTWLEGLPFEVVGIDDQSKRAELFVKFFGQQRQTLFAPISDLQPWAESIE